MRFRLSRANRAPQKTKQEAPQTEPSEISSVTSEATFTFVGASCRVIGSRAACGISEADGALDGWIRCSVVVVREVLVLTPGVGDARPLCSIPLDKIAEVDAATREELVAILRQHLGQSSSFEDDGEVALTAAVAEETAEFDTPWSCIEAAASTGAFDLPPIPLARLPDTRGGLPAVGPDTWHGQGAGRSMFLAAQYDQSNVFPRGLLDAGLPPLPPTSSRLPSRAAALASGLVFDGAATQSDDRAPARSAPASQRSRCAPWAHVILVRTSALASSSASLERTAPALSPGVAEHGIGVDDSGFVCLSFPTAGDAAAAEVALSAARPASSTLTPRRWALAADVIGGSSSHCARASSSVEPRPAG